MDSFTRGHRTAPTVSPRSSQVGNRIVSRIRYKGPSYSMPSSTFPRPRSSYFDGVSSHAIVFPLRKCISTLKSTEEIERPGLLHSIATDRWGCQGFCGLNRRFQPSVTLMNIWNIDVILTLMNMEWFMLQFVCMSARCDSKFRVHNIPVEHWIIMQNIV